MKPRPSYRLMARSGLPVAAMLIAQRRYAPPNAWTVLEYAMAATLSLVAMGFGLYGASIAMTMFGL